MRGNMRILQVTDFYRSVIGGLERHVETLSQELIRLGHAVTVVTLQSGVGVAWLGPQILGAIASLPAYNQIMGSVIS
jgi:hypothetical protein